MKKLSIDILPKKELNANIDPPIPENKLIMSIGVLGGTRLQGFSKWAVSSKSPLTGTIFRSITGGNFGVRMKHAGYDLIIIEGKAQTPSYVHTDDDGVHFIDAKSLLGLDARALQLKLKERHGAHTEAACIGIAGERLIRYAVITSGERTAARGGMGTVMGAKNIKAVSINLSFKKIVPFDRARFESLVKKQVNILKVHPRRKDLATIGTPYITTAADTLGILPTKNFQKGSIQNVGGSHMYGRPRNELTGEVDTFTEEGKGESIAQVQKEQALEDSLIACTFGNSELDPQAYSELLSSATGIEDFANVDNLFKVGERIICLERCFNVRDGFRRKDDCLPKRMTSEPLISTGPSNGQVVMNIDRLLDEYYKALGYSKNGVPTIDKIENLRLKEVIKTLSPTQ